MGFEFRQSFTVQAPPARVWAFLTDPRRAAAAMPGAALGEQLDERSFTGTVTVKVGPVTSQYQGQARFERLDAAERVVELVGSGRDVKGRGGAEMHMTSRLLEPAPGRTEVQVHTQVNVTGLLAQFGRGIVQDVSDQLFERFAAAARAELENVVPGAAPVPVEPPADAPIEALDGLSLGASVARRTLERLVSRPTFWLTVVGFLALLWWLRR